MTKNKITAVLGPTNTGKTHLAIDTMLSFDSGMIGFPLRLLAREVYDKVIKKISLDKVALITGEEKIIPSNAKYFLCTVESMPIDKDLEFVGVDEIQMCADHERGHIFTDRLLNMRGTKLTIRSLEAKSKFFLKIGKLHPKRKLFCQITYPLTPKTKPIITVYAKVSELTPPLLSALIYYHNILTKFN